MTSPGIGKPEPESDIYDDVYTKGSSFGKDLDANGVREMLVGRQTNSFLGIGGLFGGVIDKIGQALMGITQGGMFSTIDEATLRITDGQEALNDRTDLLSPLLDYGSVTMPSGQPFSGTGVLPFTRQVGPMRNVTVRTAGGGGLTFGDKGLWDIRLQATGSWVVTTGTTQVQVALIVYTPEGNWYSEQRTMFAISSGDLIKNSGEQTHVIVSSVVVPAAGYYVRGRVTLNAGTRKFLGGPMWSRLTAQHISREVDGNWDDGGETSDPTE